MEENKLVFQEQDSTAKIAALDMILAATGTVLALISILIGVLPTLCPESCSENLSRIFCCITRVSFAIGFIFWIVLFFKFRTSSKNRVTREELAKQNKIEQINQSVFRAVSKANDAKSTEVLRHSYGSVSEWNPINYLDNVLTYDVHEHIRGILSGLKEIIIQMDPSRLNPENVSVDLMYCYADEHEADNGNVPVCPVPVCPGQEKRDYKLDWKLISSIDAPASTSNIKDYLAEPLSFFTFLHCFGTVFSNAKYEQLRVVSPNGKYSSNAYARVEKVLKERIVSPNAMPQINSNSIFYKQDIKDFRGKTSSAPIGCYHGDYDGSIVGTIIGIKNDNPEEIFIRAFLTINVYGERIFKPVLPKQNIISKFFNKHQKKEKVLTDKFMMTENDYKEVFEKTILPTYRSLLTAELTQMYVRHYIRKRSLCPVTGRKIDSNANCTCSYLPHGHRITDYCHNYPLCSCFKKDTTP